MFAETKKDGEAPEITRADFIAWLRTKDPSEPYRFGNVCGRCAMGQYLTSRGLSMKNYTEAVRAVYGNEWAGGWPNQAALSAYPETFGALLMRTVAFRPFA